MNGWKRVSKRHPCPICGKPDWCLVSEDGNAVICPRTPEGATRNLGAAGYLHVIRPRTSFQIRPTWVEKTKESEQGQDLHGTIFYMVTQEWWRKAETIKAFTLGLGIPVLKKPGLLPFGWDKKKKAWGFAMVNAAFHYCGVRYRAPDGKKWSMKGGHEGIFHPLRRPGGEALFFPEGATDSLACLALGLDFEGRPSCLGGQRILETWASRGQFQNFRRLVVIGDRDKAGATGAWALAQRLVLYHDRVEILYPPPKFKDLRAWVAGGARAKDVLRRQTTQVALTVKVTGGDDGNTLGPV